MCNDSERYSPTAILAAVERAHRLYIRDADRRELFESMLADVLALTGCEYGFVAEVLHSSDGQPYLQSWALTDIAWDDVTKKMYEGSLAVDGGLIFSNLDTLFGHVLTSGEPLISNDPSTDVRSGGLPDGHPPLLSFMGLPLFRNDQMIGMVGVANRAGGFEPADIHELQPYLSVCAHMIDVIRTDRERAKAQAAEREALAAAARQDRLTHMGRLASAVAHDVNGLINVISLQCDLLEMDGGLPESVSVGIDRIQQMCDKAAEMTARLQRLRTPTADPEERCAVASAVATSSSFLRSVAGVGVELVVTCDLDPMIEIAMSDGELLQVLLNLVSNASEAMGGEGRIEVTVRAVNQQDGHVGADVVSRSEVWIDVIDDGPGIPDTWRDQVFVPFASTKGEGRGLGLAIVNSVIEGADGTVELVPTSSGTVFRLRLPVAPPASSITND